MSESRYPMRKNKSQKLKKVLAINDVLQSRGQGAAIKECRAAARNKRFKTLLGGLPNDCDAGN
jgi:hypothetical protein